MPFLPYEDTPVNPFAPPAGAKPDGLIVTRDERSPAISDGGRPWADMMGQEGNARPSFGDTLGASFRLENEVVGAVRSMSDERDFGDDDPEHNAWDNLLKDNPKLQPHWQAFVGSRNAKETEYIRSRVEQEIEDRRIREASGATGFFTDMIASLASPTILLPGGGVYKAYGLANRLKSIAAVGVAAGGGAAIQELALQQQQYLRTWQESMFNVGGATVLGGLLGGGVSYFGARQLARASRAIDEDLLRIRTETADIAGLTGRTDAPGAPRSDPQAVGAASARVVNENVMEGAYGVERAFSWQGPLTRTLANEIRAARDVMTRLAEVPFRLRQNREGIATGPAGGSVEARIKVDGDVAMYRASESLHKAFAEYRYGNADAKFAKSSAAFADMLKPQQGRLGWREFKSEITKALRSETGKGIEHPNPQVKAAAESFRKDVFEPFKKEAQKLGLFPEDAEFSFNYVMRRYDINAILNDYARFKQILVDHLKGGQARARAELAAVEREIAASRTEGDMTGEVDALSKQFEAERARVMEARSAQANVKSSIDEDAAYLDELTKAVDPQPVETIKGFRDTRGGGEFFHGSPSKVEKLDDDFYGSSVNYYGQGLYTSEAMDIANGYARRKNAKDPSVYKIEEVSPVRMYDMEQPIGDDLMRVLRAMTEEKYGDTPSVVEGALAEKPKSLREFYDEVREVSKGEGVSADEVQEGIFYPISDALVDMDYRGMSHQGGIITKSKEHLVKIYFRPGEDVRLVPVNPDDYKPGKAPAIDPAQRDLLSSERLDVETRMADEKAAERRIRAFHGSPHEFDKFTVEAIGTGEGAQAFGHGLYFAEKEGTASWYQNNLGAKSGVSYVVAGEKYKLANAHDYEGAKKAGAKIAQKHGLSEEDGASIGVALFRHSPGQSLAESLKQMKGAGRDDLLPSESADRLIAWAEQVSGDAPISGHMYEVRVKSDSETMLAWDEPLSKQPDLVKRALAPYAKEEDGQVGPALKRALQDPESEIYRALVDNGVTGIRYLDGGSRKKGEGSYNIVVFDDSLVEIVSRDGVPVKPQDQASAKAEMAKPAEPQAEPPRIELDPAVVTAVQGMASRLGIQMPDLKGLDLDGMMAAVSKSISDMTGMGKATGNTADLKALHAKADELRFIADASDQELGMIAADTISTITGSPAARGTNPYSAELLQGRSGPLKARTLKIPDEKIVDFLDDDIERIALQYVRGMAPDVALAREFGDLNLTEDLKRIQDEANNAAAANPERAAEIMAASNKAQQDIQAVTARLRGTLNIAHDPTSFGPRAAQVVKQGNVLRLMGAVLAASISDVPKLLFVHGFRQNADLFSTLVTHLDGLKMAKAEAKELSAGLEFVLSRSGQLWDAFEDMAGHTMPERALRVATNKFGRLTLMDQWNSTWKQLSGIMTMNRVLRHSVDLMNGKLNPKDLGKLAASGIDEAIAERIAAQYQTHGTVYGRLFLANANEWDDPLARQALAAAVRREADITVVTPGQERPLWTSGTYGSVVGQFRTFQLVSIQRTLIAGLQEMDAAKITAISGMIALGMLSEQLKMIIHGKENKNKPKDLGDWMYVGLANSGVLGWLTDADQMAHKVSRGNISIGKFAFGKDQPISRFASQNAVGALLGPTYGAGSDIIQTMGSAASGELKESDVHAMRRLMPYQNLFYISRALRAFEEGMIDAMGVPRTQRRN